MWGLMMTAIEMRLERLVGPVFYELSEESQQCLRTQALWAEIVVNLNDQFDGSPAANGTKAVEVELKRRVVNAAFLRAIEVDQREGRYTGVVSAKLLGIPSEHGSARLTLGQCIAALQAVALFRRQAGDAFGRSAIGRYIQSFAGGLDLLDEGFLHDLQTVAVCYRNPAAHGVLPLEAATECNRLLFGYDANGLLPFLIKASRPMSLLVGVDACQLPQPARRGAPNSTKTARASALFVS